PMPILRKPRANERARNSRSTAAPVSPRQKAMCALPDPEHWALPARQEPTEPKFLSPPDGRKGRGGAACRLPDRRSAKDYGRRGGRASSRIARGGNRGKASR